MAIQLVSSSNSVGTVGPAQQLIRQIPSEEMMAISRALGRLAGLLIQQQA